MSEENTKMREENLLLHESLVETKDMLEQIRMRPSTPLLPPAILPSFPLLCLNLPRCFGALKRGC